MKLKISRGACLFGAVLLSVALLTAFRARDDYLSTLWGALQSALPVAAAAVLHECGHIGAARLSGTPLRALCIDLFGARLHLGGLMSYQQELWVAAAGPLANLISAAAVLLPRIRDLPAVPEAIGEGKLLFPVASLGLAAVNLLPVRSLDGGRMLYCALAHTCGERAATVTLSITTALAVASLWLISAYALLRAGEMLSLFVFSLCLLWRMICTAAP